MSISFPGALPNLGRGFPGGLKTLQGLPGAISDPLNPGLGQLPTLRSPRVDQTATTTTGLGVSRIADNAPQSKPDSTRQRRLAQAQKILDNVRANRLDVRRAQPMLDQLLSPEEKQTLSRGMLIESAQTGARHHEELQALGFLPNGGGQSAAMDPTHKAGIGTNLLTDAAHAVIGMPAGMYVAGRALGEDLKDIPGNAIHGRMDQDFRHTSKDVIKPIAESYAHTYGPLVHGDFGEFGHRVAEHPLGPILDVAALASAGLGAAGRTGDALAAVNAGKIEELAGGVKGVAKVGDFTVQEFKNGGYGVRKGNEYVATNLPTKEAAVKQAQAYSTGAAMGRPFGVSGGTVSRAAQGFIKGGGNRGRFLDIYNEKTGYNHTHEIDSMVKELTSVLDPNSTVRTGKRSFGQYLSDTVKQVGADLRQTRAYGNEKAHLMQEQHNFGPMTAKGLGATGTAVREAADLVRAGAIFLRPAYLPNNWIGNEFMNLTHQGFLAPINLGKSFLMDKALGSKYLAAIDKTLGSNPATSVIRGQSRGYVSALTHPIAEGMGKLADVPFRRAAWLHEARRAGYTDLSKVKGLMDQAAAGNENALKTVADIGRRAQEEIVKFGGLTDTEKALWSRIFFVYSWMRGATRYAARFPLQHPIQADFQRHISEDVGNPYIEKNLGGGIPSYLAGAIPVGHDKNGNPIIINPLSLNPLGTGLDAAKAVVGTYKGMKGGNAFSPFSDTDVVNLFHPLAQAYVTSRGGGKSLKESALQTFAPYRLYHDLRHPGSGSVFPTTRKEAIGHYVFGAAFPRKADEQSLQRSMEREQASDPIKRLPYDVQTISKAFGDQAISPTLIQQYVSDLHEVQRMKDFQHHYAHSHGSSGFRNMPPRNRAEAAIEFLSRGHITPKQAQTYKAQLDGMKTDAEIADFASTLWGSTGVGQIKNAWDEMLHEARNQRLSRARK